MTKLTPSELLQIHEIATSHATEIEKLNGFLPFATDSDLSTMLEHERRKAEAHYHELIDIANGDSLDRRFEALDGGLTGRPRGVPPRSPEPVQPQAGTSFSDRTIASDCLDFSKSMAVRCIWAATEISHVGIRRALSEISRYHLDAAYEFYRFMERKGWYVPLHHDDSATQWFQNTHQQIAAGAPVSATR